MDKAQVQKAVEELKKYPKRNFSQSYDLIFNLKNLVIKQTPLDFFATLHYPKGTKLKIAAFVDQQLYDQATKCCDLVIRESDFQKYAMDKKLSKKLAEEYDYFIAQSTLMAKVAAAFGKILGTKGKMPNPKLGCVVPPNANMDVLVKRLNLSVRLVSKKGMNLQCMIGKDNQPDAEIIDNILTVYQTAVKQLPSEAQNIKNVQLKLTMSKPVRI
jgi:large subunit ribosomal protein L1